MKDYRICILPHGWVYVGEFKQDGIRCRLENAYNVRRWETGAGLGDLAINGPQRCTLDKTTTVRFLETTLIASEDCVYEKWAHLFEGK